MDAVTLLVVGVGLAGLLLGLVAGISIATDRVATGTADLLLAAVYLYAEKHYDSEWRAEFIEGVSDYMMANEPMVKALAKVLAKERRAGEKAAK